MSLCLHLNAGSVPGLRYRGKGSPRGDALLGCRSAESHVTTYLPKSPCLCLFSLGICLLLAGRMRLPKHPPLATCTVVHSFSGPFLRQPIRQSTGMHAWPTFVISRLSPSCPSGWTDPQRHSPSFFFAPEMPCCPHDANGLATPQTLPWLCQIRYYIPRAVAVVSSPPRPSVTHSLALDPPFPPPSLIAHRVAQRQACVCVCREGRILVAGLARIGGLLLGSHYVRKMLTGCSDCSQNS
ncbi:hypothetical protein V8C44DRAFT_310416 [Trichoderma aethiopicum]